MTESTVPEPNPEIQELKRQNDDLQRAIADVKQEMMSRLVVSELKAEALRAGIVDLDGLRLLDMDKLRIGDGDAIQGAVEVIDGLKARKPWLFQTTSSSSSAMPAPPAHPPSQKLATEMTDAEYRVARAHLIKSHAR
ncbi:MAG: hypothetical protein P4L71_08455 [Acetobacteraceae bacterium]|nr:hypothetical protein [Acetobacteraceae bacterium]